MGQKVNPIGLRLILNKNGNRDGLPTEEILEIIFKKI